VYIGAVWNQLLDEAKARAPCPICMPAIRHRAARAKLRLHFGNSETGEIDGARKAPEFGWAKPLIADKAAAGSNV
jgi:hypothetical protein